MPAIMPAPKRKHPGSQGPNGKWKRKRRCTNTKNYTLEEIETEQKRRYGEDAAARTKKCTKCCETKALVDFCKNRHCADGLLSSCKMCCTQANKEIRDVINRTKIGKCCANCGYAEDIRCLDYAHYERETKCRSKNGKTISPSHCTLRQFECERPLIRLLCRNCHADETVQENKELVERVHPIAERSKNGLRILQRSRERSELISQEKMVRVCCQRCKTHVTLKTCHRFDFDHLPGTDKMAAVCWLGSKGCPIAVLVAEMKKCQLLCKCCHLIVTLDRLEEQKNSLQLKVKLSAQDNGSIRLLLSPYNGESKEENNSSDSNIKRISRPAIQEQKIDQQEVEKYLVRDASGTVPVCWLKDKLGFRRGTQTLSKLLSSFNFVINPSRRFKNAETGRRTAGPVILGFSLKTNQEDEAMETEDQGEL